MSTLTYDLMHKQYLPAVLNIERRAFGVPWVPSDFAKLFRSRRAVGLVALSGCRVVGYAVVVLKRKRVVLYNLAVSRSRLRTGIGRQLVELVARRAGGRRIVTYVTERNLTAQLFFRACGFRWTKTVPGYFSDGEAAYRMVRSQASVAP